MSTLPIHANFGVMELTRTIETYRIYIYAYVHTYIHTYIHTAYILAGNANSNTMPYLLGESDSLHNKEVYVYMHPGKLLLEVSLQTLRVLLRSGFHDSI